MLLPDLFAVYTQRLNQAGLAYMITGSVAGMIYGEPRITHAIDLILRMNFEDVDKLLEAFPNEDFYAPPAESLRVEVRRRIRGHFNLIHHQTGFKADIYLEGRDPLHLWAMGQRRSFELDGHVVWFAPPEYVIIRKLEFHQEGGSEKHLTDIAAMLAVTDVEKDQIVGRLTPEAREVFGKLLSSM